ncbi:MAG: hypothetical protein K2M95_04710 [Clostridiales bacterium]|nr:hypothetical protein [Clostridiales bacterium]
MEIGKKIFKIVGAVLSVLLALFLFLYATLGIIGGFMYREARKYRTYAFTIPALSRGFTPQGVEYIGDGTYLTTGYDGKTDETLLYVAKGKKATRVLLGDAEGAPLQGHGGGVAAAKDFVYVACEDSLCMFRLSDLIQSNGDRVRSIGELKLPCKASFCFSDGTNLYAGEFYRKGNFETNLTHRMTTPNDDFNPAIVACFDLSDDGTVVSDGQELPFPSRVLSITGLVQGFAVHDGVCMLSRSYGLVNSKLEYYAEPYAAGELEVTIEDDKRTVPLFVLDSSNKFRTLTLPSFSEDLAIANDRVVVMNEAACNKYIIGKLFLADKAYSYPIFSPNK